MTILFNVNRAVALLLLTAVWIILCERLSPATVAAGIIVSLVCIIVCDRLLPFKRLTGVKLLRLMFYPLYLIGQVYIAGITSIGIILSSAETEIIEVDTELKNEFLRVLFANSITLTPGNISLGLKGDKITVLCLKKENSTETAEERGVQIKHTLERVLLKMQNEEVRSKE